MSIRGDVKQWCSWVGLLSILLKAVLRELPEVEMASGS